MFICAVSLTLHETMDVAVHNRYPDIGLVSPVYFCSCGTCYEYPVKRTNTDVVVKIGFRFDIDQNEPGGILMYKVQRKSDTRFDRQSSTNTIYAKAIEEASEMMQLLITWKIKHFEESKVNIVLVEYGNELVLNEDKLVQLYENDIPSEDNPFKWLMYDNTVLAARHELVRKTGFESRITVYEGVKDERTMKPMWIESER
jgi:hypothetical protein